MWAHSFDLESTREENFHVNEATTVQVPMMFQSNTIKYLNDSVLPCQLVQLDYTGNETVFFVLPVKGKMDSVITALSRDTIQRLKAVSSGAPWYCCEPSAEYALLCPHCPVGSQRQPHA